MDIRWKSIIETYFTKTLENTRKEGPGINVFKMMEKERSPFNCEYFYAIRGDVMWETILLGTREKFDAAYDPENMVAISLHLSYKDGATSQIKLFKFDGSEVSFL